MNKDQEKLLSENTAAIREMQNDFQKFYKFIKHILPEIEHTKTLTRLEKEMEDSRKKIKIDLVWDYQKDALKTGSAATSVASTNYAPGMMEGGQTIKRTACRIY